MSDVIAEFFLSLSKRGNTSASPTTSLPLYISDSLLWPSMQALQVSPWRIHLQTFSSKKALEEVAESFLVGSHISLSVGAKQVQNFRNKFPHMYGRYSILAPDYQQLEPEAFNEATR